MPSPPDKSSNPPWWPVALVTGLALTATFRGKPKGATATATTRGGSGAGGDQRGRDAASPTDIPAAGWKDIVWRVYGGINDDRILAVAAGVTFYALLALFPTVAAFVSLYGLFSDPASISSQLNSLSGILPSGAMEIVGEQVKRIATKPHGSLSFAFVFSLLVALWSSNAGMKAVFDALNVAYEEKERRSFVVLNLVSLLFTVCAILMLIVAAAAVVVVPVLLNFFGLGGIGTTLLALARWPVLLVVIILALSVLYRFGPSREKAKWRWITPGSAFASVAWLIASVGFSIYVAKFGSYNATYGSLGAAIGLMTWMWISSIVILVGAEISAQIEHQTARDTTDRGKPLGQRGAKMADHVGAGR